MRTKISCSKLTRYRIQQSAWLPILIGIVALFAFPIRYAVQLQETQRFDLASNAATLAADKYEVAVRCIGASTFVTAFLVTVAAVLCAAVSFAYLHAKEKTDFYHSLSLQRSALLWSGFLQGWLSAVIPYLVMVLLALFGIGGLYHNVTGAVVGHTFASIGITILGFSAAYSLCVLAMLLSGKILTGIFLMAFLCFFGPCCYYVFTALAGTCFSTIADVSGQLGLWFSPVTILAYLGSQLSGDLETKSHFTGQIIALLLYFALPCLISLFVAKRRPSETAGNALIHPNLARILKVLITVPAALGFGLIMAEAFAASLSSLPFFAFLFAFIISSCIEFLFYADLRMIFRHWKSLLISLILTALALGFFLADPLGIDTWVPDAESVDSIALEEGSIAFSDFCESYYATNDALDTEVPVDTDAILSMIQESLDGVDYINEDTYTTTVTYHMKNGSTHRRSYTFYLKDLFSLFAGASEDPAWRQKYYPFMKLEAVTISSFYVIDPVTETEDSVSMALSREDRESLVAALQADAAEVTLAEIHDTQPLFGLTLISEGNNWEINQIYVYPQYTRTIAFIKSLGYTDEELDFAAKRQAQVQSVTVYYYLEEAENAYQEFQMTLSGDALAELYACTEFAKSTIWNESSDGCVSADVQMYNSIRSCLLRITDADAYEALREEYGIPEDAS